jgi:myo-inositol 2-dehydrogenase / D-chiro-inositol 1-dehydrogenase
LTIYTAADSIHLDAEQQPKEASMSDRPHSSSDRTRNTAFGRRRFITGTTAAGLSLTILAPGLVRGSRANSKLKLGMIGCGMRGLWIADLFLKHGGYELTAAADYFQDRADQFGEKFGVPPERRFAALSGYKRLLEQKLDAVAIETPPYFHPEQAAAAVDAGIHVMLAKPVAVDVPGTLLVGDLGPRATANNLCFYVDFQTRSNPFFKEAVKRVHFGDIGRIGFGEACFNGGDVWNSWNPVERLLEAAPNDPEARLKAWGMDRVLSGDIMVEQCVHSIDVATWILDKDPVSAYGNGGRNHYKQGDIWDCFAVTYRFPENVPIHVNAKQFGEGFGNIGCRMYGLRGTIDTAYGGDVSIRGRKPYRGGNTGNLYPEGTAANIAEFYDQVAGRHFINATVAPSVRSNLTSILGRDASYANREVTWKEMMEANQRLESEVVKKLKA